MGPQVAQSATRVCLLEEHKLLCRALGDLLQRQPGIDVIATCTSSTEVLRVAGSGHVDVLLMDLPREGSESFDLLSRLQDARFTGKVLVLASGLGDHNVVRLAALGISGIILKDSHPSVLSQCIRQVARGIPWFQPDQLRAILREFAHSNSGTRSGFSESERTALKLLLDGASNKEIADRMGVGLSKVKSVFQALFRKTGVRTRTQLVRVALEKRLEVLG